MAKSALTIKHQVPKSNPIPATLSTVNGYPDRLKIYQIPASPYWWCRATFGERRITRSTKQTEKKKAVSFAKEFYEGLLRHDSPIPIGTSRSFERCAMALLDEHRQRTSAGERNARFADDLRKQLTHRILPYFKSYPLREIDYQVMSRFVDSMRAEKASSSTIQRNLVSVRQVLKHAQKLGLVDSVPIFPIITTKDNPRPWFSDDEYDSLKATARSVARQFIVIKNEPLTKEVRDFIVFMVNTFLRPSDWYNLRRKHIRVQERSQDTPFLVISPSIVQDDQLGNHFDAECCAGLQAH